MKRAEITFRSDARELEKLAARLERAEKSFAKKRAAAEKMGVADWTVDEWRTWIETVETTENGWIVNKADVKKNGAFNDMYFAEQEIADVKARIEKAEARFEKSRAAVEAVYKKIREEEDLKKKEALAKAEFEQEKKEWAKDGIELEGRYYGRTPNGAKFWVERNHGFTNRSFHCFTLTIGGETVFTSGEFWRCYAVIRKR